nr:unnamed protein product [Rangifer tarandus platyrhynchus]
MGVDIHHNKDQKLIKRLGPRRSMATGRRLQYPSRPRAAHARGCRIDRDSLGSIALRPRPSSARVARQPRIGELPLAGGAPGSRATRGQLVSVAGGLAPGAGRCRLPSDLSRLGEGDAGGKGAKGGWSNRPVLEKSLLTRVLSRGRTSS